MARVCPAPERTLLGGQSLGQHTRVEVRNESGTWKDLTALGGKNFLKSWSTEESVDQGVASGIITVLAGDGADSLHPLRTDSALNVDDLAAYSPLLFGGRLVRISTGASAAGASSPSTPWRRVFEGIIDEPAAGDNGGTLTVQARDLGALLLDRYPETPRSYGSAAGVDLEVVMQQILDDEGIAATITLPGGSPNWVLKEFLYDGTVSVGQQLRNMAQQIGWDIRYRWLEDNPDTNTLELQLYDPDRTKTTPDWTLPPSEYLTVEELKFGDRNVRNVIGIWFFDAAAGNARTYRFVKDDASIAIYGRRYMQIAEQFSSNINTETEALKMINAALSDLSTPFVDHTITTLDLWFAQLGDLVALPANDVHYNDDQAFALVSIRRTWAEGVGRVSFRTRGKPGGAYSDWIRKAGMGPDPNLGPSPIFGEPIGEDSEGGGVSGDGMIWLEGRLDARTVELRAYAEQDESEAPAVPDVSAITLAWALKRPEGSATSVDDWPFMLGFATNPFWYKRIRVFGVDKDGIAGPETVFDPCQALDLVSVVDGVIEGIAITFGTDNVLDIDIGDTDPVEPSFLVVMRNGVVIEKRSIGLLNNYTETVTDAGVNVNGKYTYEAFIWTRGITGAHVVYGANMPPPPLNTLPLPGKLKIIAMQVMDFAGAPELRIDYKANVIGFARAVLEESDDDGVGDAWADSVTLSQNPGTFSGSFWVADETTPRYYRVRVDKIDGTSIYSASRLWNLVDLPPPAGTPGAPPQFVNQTPRLVYLGFSAPTVEIEYDISATAFTSMRLEVSANGISGWVEIDSATSQHGLFYDTNTFTKWYRLRAIGASVDLYSQPAYFPGYKPRKGGGSATDAPVFTLSLQGTGPNGINDAVLRIAWTCTNPQAYEVTIERSLDDGGSDPWTEVRRDASVPSGYWDTTAFESYYYRMVARDVADGILATSASQQYQSTTYFP